MTEQITSSYNLFVDSSNNHTTNSKGDDFLVSLQDAGVNCGDGEHIRLTLDNFSMAKTFTDVNANNNQFRMRATVGGALDAIGYLPNKNYRNVTELAQAFADAIRLLLSVNRAGCTVAAAATNVLPAVNTSNDNVISFVVNTTGNHGFQLNDAVLQFNEAKSDSYQLLGGDRVSDGDNTTNSVNMTFPSANSIKIVCKYPAQRSTMPFVYIRAPGVLKTNIETKGLRHPADDHKSDTAQSDILGRVVVESSEWVQYTAQTGREFFLDIHQKSLNFLRLKLTDGHNRPLGRLYDTQSNTATGTGLSQSTLGNLNFSAVIRFDIIKSKNVLHLESKHHEPSIPARFSDGRTPLLIRDT